MEGADDHIMVGHGYYLEQEKAERDGTVEYVIKQLLEDEELGMCKMTAYTFSDWGFVFKAPWKGPSTAVKSMNFRAPSRKMALDHFVEWVKKLVATHLAKVDESLFSDVRKARKARSNEGKDTWLRRLKKDDTESGMNDAVTFFNNEEEAFQHHLQMVKNNPKQRIAHNLHTLNDLGHFTVKLVNGKKLPAGHKEST